MVFQKRVLPIALAGLMSVSMIGCGYQLDTPETASPTGTQQTEQHHGNPLTDSFNRVFGKDDAQTIAEQEAYNAYVHPQIEEDVTANEIWTAPDAERFSNTKVISCDDGFGGKLSVGVKSGSVSEDIDLMNGLILNVTDTKAESGEVLLGVRFQSEYGDILALGSNGAAYSLSLGSAYDQTVDELAPVMAIGRTFDERLSAMYDSDTAPGPVWTYTPEDFTFPDSFLISMEVYNLSDNSFLGYYDITVTQNDDNAYELESIKMHEETSLTPAEMKAIKDGVIAKMEKNDLFTTTQTFTADDVILKSVNGARWSEMWGNDGNGLLSSDVPKTVSMIAATVNTNDGRIGPVTLYYQLIRSAVGEEQSDGDPDEKTTAVFYGYDFIGQTSWDALIDMNGLTDTYGQIGLSTISAYKPIR